MYEEDGSELFELGSLKAAYFLCRFLPRKHVLLEYHIDMTGGFRTCLLSYGLNFAVGEKKALIDSPSRFFGAIDDTVGRYKCFLTYFHLSR